MGVALKLIPNNTKALQGLSKLFDTARDVCVKSAKQMGTWVDGHTDSATPVRTGALKAGWEFSQGDLGFSEVNVANKTSKNGKTYFYAIYVQGYGAELLPRKSRTKPVFEGIARAAMIAHFGQGASSGWTTGKQQAAIAKRKASAERRTAKKAEAMAKREQKRRAKSRSGASPVRTTRPKSSKGRSRKRG